MLIVLKLSYTRYKSSIVNSKSDSFEIPTFERLKKERSWMIVNLSTVWKGFNPVAVFNSRWGRRRRRRHEHRSHRGTNRMEIISAINCFNLPWKFKQRWRTGDSSLSRNLEPRCKSNSGVKVADREREETCIKPFRYRLLNGAAFLLIFYVSKGGFDFKRNFKFKRGREEKKYKWTKTYHGWILRGSDLLRVNY